jgi:hypothetical protein
MGVVIDAQQRFGRHMTEAMPAAYGMQAVGCMDDRHAQPTDRVLGNQLYHQLHGGAHGMGLDLAVAMEMQRAGSVVAKGSPVHVLGNVAVKVLRGSGYNPVLHRHCAAFEGAKAIANTTTNAGNDSLVFQRALAVEPNLTNEDYWRVVEATKRILDAELIVPTGQAARDFAQDSKEMPMVPTATLVDEEHTAAAFLINDNSSNMFDVAAARAAGDPAYCVSIGAVRDMHAELQDVIPVTAANLLAATAVRLSVISTHHLLGPKQQPLPILRLAA